jgi:hypothetical protein
MLGAAAIVDAAERGSSSRGQRGRDINAIEDPLPRIVGCFDDTKMYPTDRLVLTYPVRY